jgi:hypothetical protein
MRCSGCTSPPLAMASSSLRFFSATRSVVGQRRLRSAIHASISSGVSSRTFVPRMGIGFLRSATERERLAPGARAKPFIYVLRMDENVPFQARVCVPIRLALASVPSWWVDQMAVCHVHLHRFCRAGECAAGVGAFAVAGCIPVRMGCATRRKGVTAA